jgi:Zn-dependent peptidase ImmA (M78 family)
LSGVVGISFSTLASIERGEGSPDNNSKIRLIEWLGSDADDADLRFDNVAHVHFRAMKNVQSGTVQSLLKAAACLEREYGHPRDIAEATDTTNRAPELSKDQLEAIAAKFRSDLGLRDSDPVDSLRINVEGVRVEKLTHSKCLDGRTMRKLRDEACSEWSAMSVPLDIAMGKWAVLLNDRHTIERQRVTILDEFWHILMGHKLTKVARVAEAYGRTYDKSEEHDAYYLAAATLLPRKAVEHAVAKRQSSPDIAKGFGTSPELVDYRIKRLGLWRDFIGKKVALDEP